MRFPPGVDRDTAIFGYMQALQGFSIDAIAYGIQRFLRGECEGVNPKYCPHPPELASIIRETMKQAPKRTGTGKLYGYNPPRSKLIKRGCTKDWARSLVDNHAAPRGSIWCPGSMSEGKPDIGDLYGPDPDWKGPWPLDSKSAE